MGIEFTIDAKARVVYYVGRGKITVQDVANVRKRVNSHPDYKGPFAHLFDYREGFLLRDTSQSRSLAHSLTRRAKIAVVAGEKSYGTARMFQGWVGDDRLVKIFRDMASAREWLGLPREDDS